MSKAPTKSRKSVDPVDVTRRQNLAAARIIAAAGGYEAVAEATGAQLRTVKSWTWPTYNGIPWDLFDELRAMIAKRGVPFDDTLFRKSKHLQPTSLKSTGLKSSSGQGACSGDHG